jgi:ABC-type branched-subunit amino acid transport system substrate-binding protein
VSALFALACATETPPSATEQASFDQAAALARTNPDQAITRLEALRLDNPDSALADEIALTLAQLYLAKKDDGRAANALERGLEGQPSGNRSDEVRLQLAQLEAKRGRRETAYQVLAPVRLGNLTAQQRREALRLLADLARARRDPVNAVIWLARLRAEAPDDDAVALVDVEIDQQLGDLGRPEIEQLVPKLKGAVPAGRARIREAELAIQMSQLEAAGQALAEASALPLTKADAQRLVKAETLLVKKGGKLPKEIAQKPGPETKPATPPVPAGATESVTTVGVVLPLSGKFSKFGEESLNGILLAAGVFEENPPPGTAGVRLVVRDSAATPDAAAAAVTELSSDTTVAAVIGPLLAEETESAATAAESASLPLLTLSGKESATGQSPHVYRFGATARAEADALAEYTIKTLNLKRFGVLYPEDPYGRGLRDLFSAAVQARGGTVVRSIGYDPHSRELVGSVREVLGPAGPPGAKAALDAIFVPDTREKGVLAAQALAAQGAGNVRVLGVRGWLGPDLLRLGGTAMEGAIFSEPFDAASSSLTVTDFSRRYHLSYGKTPDVMAAQAYDAARVLFSALPPGSTSRVELEERIRRVHGYPGAAGTITLQEDGTVQKTPAIRGVRGGRIVELQ